MGKKGYKLYDAFETKSLAKMAARDIGNKSFVKKIPAQMGGRLK